MELPVLRPQMGFDEAAALVVDFLKESVPLGVWTVTGVADGVQTYLHARDDAYGLGTGHSHRWADSLCRHVIEGSAPQIAPDSMAVPALAGTAFAASVQLGASVSVPITGGDGELFGTICGLDPEVQPAQLESSAPVLELLASLLGEVLRADRWRTEALRREQELRQVALHDHLTGLVNRGAFLDRLERALALRRRDRRGVAVLLVDVDDFKAVNDTLGHAAGDALLVGLAARLDGAVRGGDTVARLGGDEFAVLVEHGEDAAVAAQRVVRAAAQPFELLLGHQVEVGVSVGLAELPPGGDPVAVDELMARADAAMYVAKRSGKGRAAVHDPSMELPEARDLELREPLRRALAEDRVQVAYQPVVELGTGRVAGFEALARWEHRGRPVSPAEFVPVAARGGLMTALTAAVLEQSCAQLAAWSALTGRDDLRMSVNVAPSMFTGPDLVALAAAGVRRHGLRAGQLVLEVTEDALPANLDEVLRTCGLLADLGVMTCLDDFGAGYSSLLHLQQFPLSSVKINRGFAADLDTDPGARRFMRALLAMGRDLGLRVIVSGVERAAQADVLRDLGATHAQGHLFARPTAAGDVRLLLDPARAPGGVPAPGGIPVLAGTRVARG